MALTDNYEEAIQILREPFWTDRLEVRPGSFNNRDKNQATKAIALVYYDWRVMEDRLDCVVGPANWRAHLVPWGPKLICELTILGVTKESSGEEESKKENVGTATEAQCKKRAASSHGIGRYLYFVKDIWGELNKYKNGFEDPDAIIRQIYRESRNLVGRSIDFPYDLTKYIGSPGRVNPNRQDQPSAEPEPEEAPAQVGQSDVLKQMIRKAKGRAGKAKVASNADQWSVFVSKVLGSPKPDAQIDLKDIAKINGELTRLEQAQPAQANG